jgi:dihydrolipoamide dehydrogenase
LGSKVTIIEILENILPGLEGELTRNLRRLLEKDGIKVLTQSSVKEIQYIGEGLKLAVETPEGLQKAIAEKVLLAVGRVPNLNIDFLMAGVETSSNGIRVNHWMETTAPHIYAIGDAIGGILLAHVAMEEGVVAAENAMGFNQQIEDHLIPLCIFTYPEIASIGLTEKEAREKGEIKVGRFPFRSNPKAMISGETEGLIKVIASRENDKILGVHIIGLDACNLISIVSSVMEQGVKVKEFSQFIQAHPTVQEALKEAFLDVDGMAIHLPRRLQEHKK